MTQSVDMGSNKKGYWKGFGVCKSLMPYAGIKAQVM